MFDSLLVKVLAVVSLTLLIYSAFVSFEYQGTKADLKLLQTQYKSLQDAYSVQTETIRSLNANRGSEAKTEVKYVEKIVDNCKKESVIIKGIQNIPIKVENNVKSNIVDPDGVLGNELTKLLQSAYNSN